MDVEILKVGLAAVKVAAPHHLEFLDTFQCPIEIALVEGKVDECSKVTMTKVCSIKV